MNSPYPFEITPQFSNSENIFHKISRSLCGVHVPQNKIAGKDPRIIQALSAFVQQILESGKAETNMAGHNTTKTKDWMTKVRANHLNVLLFCLVYGVLQGRKGTFNRRNEPTTHQCPNAIILNEPRALFRKKVMSTIIPDDSLPANAFYRSHFRNIPIGHHVDRKQALQKAGIIIFDFFVTQGGLHLKLNQYSP